MPDIVAIEGPAFSRVRFPNGAADEELTNGIFEDVAGNTTTFERVNFSFSVFIRAYFHKSNFVDCQFTGCRFESCNFREARFSQCDFKYASFDKTILPVREIIASAPEWPNVKRVLMQNLRANAESLGDVEAQRAFIREEMKARREHLRRARDRQEAYYARKYAGLQNWVSIRWQSFWLWVDRNLLGYGEHIGRAVIGSCILLVLIALIQFALTVDLSISITSALSQLVSSCQYVFFLLLDVPETKAQPPVFLAILVIMLRYFLVGVLVAALFRLLSHR
jgi:hypothetical protein